MKPGSIYLLRMTAERYPEAGSMFRAELAVREQRFADAREDFLLGYSYNTARAYWGDLEHLYDWCEHREFDISVLTEAQFREYQALLRRRRYGESTIRRRATAWRGLKSKCSPTPPVRRKSFPCD